MVYCFFEMPAPPQAAPAAPEDAAAAAHLLWRLPDPAAAFRARLCEEPAAPPLLMELQRALLF